MQVTCEQDEDDLSSKNSKGLIIGCIGMLIVWIYHFTVGFIYKQDVINETRYDMELLTASDYTIAGPISKT